MKKRNGDFVLPNHLENYLRWNETYDNTIIIFEHLGNDTNILENNVPQCELIIIKKKLKPIGEEVKLLVYSLLDKLYDELNNLYVMLNKTYSLNIVNKQIPVPKNLINKSGQYQCKIISQYIDNYGKTRIINIEFKGIIFSVLTNPLPNFDVKEENISESYKKIKLEDCLSFIKYIGGEIVNKSCVEINKTNFCIELHVTYNDIMMTFPIDYMSSSKVVLNKITNNQSIKDVISKFNLDKSDSKLQKYQYLLKSSILVSEYGKYLFSEYINDPKNNINYSDLLGNDTTKIYNDFIKNYMVIKKDHKYENTTQIFNKKNNSIIENGKLIISDKNPHELIRRIIYGIR